MWCIAARYAEGGDGTRSTTATARVDYKDILEPEAFARFVEWRKRRKEIADADELPVFAVFTDKELAGIAELENPKPDDLKTVKGIGTKKVERFGARLLSHTEEKNKDDQA